MKFVFEGPVMIISWAVAKSACGLQSRDSIPPLADSGCVAISSLDKADCLNRAFAAQCSAPSSTPPTLPMGPPGSKFTFSMISIADVLKRLASLNVWKASGLDELPNGFLKECRFAIAEPLTHIFNFPLSTGVFPAAWKVGSIQPVYKQSRSCATSYRPITLLSCVSKILEGFVRLQLLTYSFDIGVIPDQQFGFLPKRSTVRQLLAVVDNWELALDEGRCVHACFLDVAKAFDRVDHGLLLFKLQRSGICGVPL